MTPQLPPNPNLQQLRNQAKELLKSRKLADPNTTIGLQECQQELAQSYGFKNWKQLIAHVNSHHDRSERSQALQAAVNAKQSLVQVRERDIHRAFGKVGEMLSSGIPFLQTFAVVAEECEDRDVALAFAAVHDRVASRQGIEDILGEFDALFPKSVQLMWKAGLSDPKHLPECCRRIARMDNSANTSESRIDIEEVHNFFSSCAAALEKGITLHKALKAAAQVASNSTATLITSICKDVEAGNTLSQALSKPSGAFNSTCLSMVRAGEATGELNKFLRQIVELRMAFLGDLAEEPGTSALRYVNLLLVSMANKKQELVILSRSKPLPNLRVPGSPETLAPDLTHVINRLKVMCGLNPATYRKPADASCTLKLQGQAYNVKVRFDDKADDSLCSIRLLAAHEQADNGATAMKRLIEDSHEAQRLAMVPAFAQRLAATRDDDLPLSVTAEEKLTLLQSISGELLQEFDGPDMAPQVEVTRCHDRGHPDTIFVAFMRDSTENDQKFRHMWYWPDGRPYALMGSDVVKAYTQDHQ